MILVYTAGIKHGSTCACLALSLPLQKAYVFLPKPSVLCFLPNILVKLKHTHFLRLLTDLDFYILSIETSGNESDLKSLVRTPRKFETSLADKLVISHNCPLQILTIL